VHINANYDHFVFLRYSDLQPTGRK